MKIMDKKELQKLNIEIGNKEEEMFANYARIFLEKNSHLNLISKNDEKVLFEKHIFDSLAINLFLNPKVGQTLLDIGTGGGFPAIPVAIFYPDLKVYPLDSIRKKIKAIEEIKDEMGLKNVFPVCERAENIKEEFDYITSRAVAPVETILKYAFPLLKKGGYFIAYKSQKANEEIDAAQKTIKRFNAKLVKIIDYRLPLEENFERKLVIFQKIK